MQDGACARLRWTRIDVPGSKPANGFGAGVVLDSLDNLYITGGVSSTLTEVDDLFVFQLRDPFYKFCSSTGSALTAGLAGVQSIFYMQCRDAFNEPADGARFSVQISGPVDMIPPIKSLGNGKYSVAFTAVKVGQYFLSIKLGRGGPKFQDMISGLDSEPTNNMLDGEFLPQCAYESGSAEPKCSTNPNPYTMTITPGPTSPAVTSAAGTRLTLATAGTLSDFVITAKDAFGNRRPGGDTISVLIEEWGCQKVKQEDRGLAAVCLAEGAVLDAKKMPQTGYIL